MAKESSLRGKRVVVFLARSNLAESSYAPIYLYRIGEELEKEVVGRRGSCQVVRDDAQGRPTLGFGHILVELTITKEWRRWPRGIAELLQFVDDPSLPLCHLIKVEYLVGGKRTGQLITDKSDATAASARAAQIARRIEELQAGAVRR